MQSGICMASVLKITIAFSLLGHGWTHGIGLQNHYCIIALGALMDWFRVAALGARDSWNILLEQARTLHALRDMHGIDFDNHYCISALGAWMDWPRVAALGARGSWNLSLEQARALHALQDMHGSSFADHYCIIALGALIDFFMTSWTDNLGKVQMPCVDLRQCVRASIVCVRAM